MHQSQPEGRILIAPLKRKLAVVVFAFSIVAIVACDNEAVPVQPVDQEAQAFRDVGVDQSASALVPAAIRKQGKLVSPTAATYPPNEFIAEDGETIIGMDPDLARAISQRLNLELELKAENFDSIIPGVASGKYKLSFSSATVTPERTRQVDMITYFSAGTGFFSSFEEPITLSGLAGLCGFSVGVASKTVQQSDARRQSRRCQARGEEPVRVRTFANQSEATQSVESGQSDFGMADTPVVSYIVKKSEGRLLKVGKDYGVAPYGAIVNRDSKLAPAVKTALDSLVNDGTYEEILSRWGLEDYAIKRPTIEP